MSADRKLQVSGTVDAPPQQVFALLADPARHTELDGAGMLRGLGSPCDPVTAVGDSFVMNMDQDGIGEYQMRNEITAFEADRRIVWAPTIHPPGALSHILGELDPSGHTYGWELAPTAEGGTQITHVYDWSGVADENAIGIYPRVSQEQMSGSITRIGDALR